MSISSLYPQQYAENISHHQKELSPIDALKFYEALDAEFGMTKQGESIAELAYKKMFTETSKTFPGIGMDDLKVRLAIADDKAYEVRDQEVLGSHPAPDRTDYKLSGEDQVKIHNYVQRFALQSE